MSGLRDGADCPTSAAGFRLPGLRWIIAVLLFLSTVICYLDRLTVAVLAPVIKSDLSLSNVQYATIMVWFLIPYAVFQAIFGRVFDRFGTRRTFGAAISLWSVSAVLHAAARGFAGFAAFRLCLGIGEAGNWPGSIKAIAEWFPARQRAFGLSIVNCGAALGSVVATPLIVGLQLRFGWRAAFIATGVLGFFWLILWFLLYDSPDRSHLITPAERALLCEHDDRSAYTPPAGAVAQAPQSSGHFGEVIKYKQVWAIVLARFFGDPIWWLYLTWLPSYLYDVRRFSMQEIGAFGWLPFLASGVGSLSGGWLSSHLITRGLSVDAARKIAIVIPTLLMPMGIGAIVAPTAYGALAFISLELFGFQFWVNNIQTLPSDYLPQRYVATVAGLSQAGAGAGAVLSTLSIGWIVDHFSYAPVLVMGGLLGPVATLAIFALGGKIEALKPAHA